MNFVMSLPPDVFIDLSKEAAKKNVEDLIWQKWLVELPRMDSKTFIPFTAYLSKHTGAGQTSQPTMTDNEILADADNILKMMSKPK